MAFRGLHTVFCWLMSYGVSRLRSFISLPIVVAIACSAALCTAVFGSGSAANAAPCPPQSCPTPVACLDCGIGCLSCDDIRNELENRAFVCEATNPTIEPASTSAPPSTPTVPGADTPTPPPGFPTPANTPPTIPSPSATSSNTPASTPVLTATPTDTPTAQATSAPTVSVTDTPTAAPSPTLTDVILTPPSQPDGTITATPTIDCNAPGVQCTPGDCNDVTVPECPKWTGPCSGIPCNQQRPYALFSPACISAVVGGQVYAVTMCVPAGGGFEPCSTGDHFTCGDECCPANKSCFLYDEGAKGTCCPNGKKGCGSRCCDQRAECINANLTVTSCCNTFVPGFQVCTSPEGIQTCCNGACLPNGKCDRELCCESADDETCCSQFPDGEDCKICPTATPTPENTDTPTATPTPKDGFDVAACCDNLSAPGCEGCTFVSSELGYCCPIPQAQRFPGGPIRICCASEGVT